MGRKYKVYNPTRCSAITTNCGEQTWGYTTYGYDPLSRVNLITEQDGSTVSTDYSAFPCVTVTDEASKMRQSCTDGLGRLTSVTENPGGLNYLTSYSYDALDNLTSVTQVGSHQRSFTYDSLSRLTIATNPESGTICYGTVSGGVCQQNGYDANGNLITKTDARGIITCFGNLSGSSCDGTGYDALNRVTLKSYSDGTPSAFFSWDGTGRWGVNQTNTIGRLGEQWTGTSCCASGGGAEVFSYDAMGRTIFSDQYTVEMGNNGLYSSYDLLGDMLSASNGVGVTISYGYSTAARPTGVTSSLNDSQHPSTLASSITYWPTGGVLKMAYGNGLTGTNVYNNRMQPCLIDVNQSNVQLAHCSDGTPTGNLLDFWTGYNEGSADNGNIIHWNATGWQSFIRTYSYDNVNRVSTLSDSITANPCNALTWSYDAWGNRNAQSIGTGGSSCGTFSQTADANNHLPSSSGYQYDAAGDLIYDGSHHYFYDAENRLIQVDGTLGSCSSPTTACYFYDALGHRVEKWTAYGWVSYLHDTDGNAVTEWCNNCGGTYTGWATGYVYLGSQLLAEYANGTTYFVHEDHLGSTRLLTYVNGNKYDSLDFLPFGEQIAGDTGTTHKFTGKERDGESGLDNFGARYYTSQLGRFMVPDWAAKPTAVPYANFGNPQSLNLYSYVENNPTTVGDPDGHCFEDACAVEGATGLVIVGTAAITAAAIYVETPSAERSLRTFTSAFSDVVSSDVQSIKGWFSNSQPDKQSTLVPGPYAGEGIPARDGTRKFTPDEREQDQRTRCVPHLRHNGPRDKEWKLCA